jgi:hypothetical protein
MSHGELEKECAGLHAAVDTLKQEEAQIKTDCELKLRRSKKNQDYCIGHRKRLHELHANLEKAVNEIGLRCLPYPGKSSTISEIIMWFDKEI